jgi:hypothetical protein
MAKLFDRETSVVLMKAAQRNNAYARNEVGKIILTMVRQIKSKPKWRGYTGELAERMQNNAVDCCLKYMNRWDESKGCSPYSYFQMIITCNFMKTSVRFGKKLRKRVAIPLSRLGEHKMLEELLYSLKDKNGGRYG